MKEYDQEFQDLKRRFKFDSLDKELVLFDKVSDFSADDVPHKAPENISITCLQGSMEIGINLKRYLFEAPCFISIKRGTIVQRFGTSSDFRGQFVVVSNKFGKRLELTSAQIMPFLFYFDKYPSVPLSSEEAKLLSYSFRIVRLVVAHKNNPYRVEIVKHLVQAFYYGISMIMQKHIDMDSKKQSRQESIFEEFMICVQKYYRQERGLEFYADKLAITTKHLSSVIKTVSSKSAKEWLDEHIVLEAKVLLKTTKMTIQQISDELNFTDQSFFGRYFKNHVGLSPKKFRESNG